MSPTFTFTDIVLNLTPTHGVASGGLFVVVLWDVLVHLRFTVLPSSRMHLKLIVSLGDCVYAR